jgi:hypothetical protein
MSVPPPGTKGIINLSGRLGKIGWLKTAGTADNEASARLL